MVGFCNFAKFHPKKVISNLKTEYAQLPAAAPERSLDY